MLALLDEHGGQYLTIGLAGDMDRPEWLIAIRWISCGFNKTGRERKPGGIERDVWLKNG